MAQNRTNKPAGKKLYYIIGGLGLLIIVLLIGRQNGWIGKSKELEVEVTKAFTGNIVEIVAASGT
ncbi:MAG: efflux transporter periplasmic adaptor subunit, partial [Bacteroidota bacterium]